MRFMGFEALIDIRAWDVLEDKLPRRALMLVLDRAEMHQAELLEDVDLSEQLRQPGKIKPLE